MVMPDMERKRGPMLSSFESHFKNTEEKKIEIIIKFHTTTAFRPAMITSHFSAVLEVIEEAKDVDD